jgi:acyl-CoA thioesterase II
MSMRLLSVGRWFHTPFRADDWLLYHMQCLRLENNHGLCLGKIYTRDGRLAVSVCQEGLLRLSPIAPTPSVKQGERSAEPRSKL